MATVLAVDKLLQLKVECKTVTQLGINLYYWRVSSILLGLPTDQDAADIFDQVVGPAYIDVLSAHANYAACKVQILQPPPMPTEVGASVNAGAGNRTGDLMPTNVAGIITKKTGFAGRAYRGRAYIPFPAEDDNGIDGLPVAGYLGNLGALAAIVFSDFTFTSVDTLRSATLTPVLRHDKAVAIPGTNPITSYRVNAKWANQHRRGDYGRPNT